MRTEALLLIATVSLLVTNACSKETPEPPKGEEKVFIAQSGEEDDTKTAFQDDAKSIWWSPYDAICIYYGASDGDKFTATNDTEVAKAEFRGTLTAFTGVSESGDFNYFWAVYPYAAARGCDGNSVTAELSELQTAKAGSFAPNTNIAIAKSPGLALSFFNACAWFRFSLTKEGVKRVIFRGNGNEDIAGTFRISMGDDGRPTAPVITQGKKEIILEMPAHQAFEVGAWYYITLLPQVLENGFTVTLETDSETGSRTVNKIATFVRSKYNNGKEFDKDVVYGPDIVSFADANFKAYCVQNFDTNGDGEISGFEARSVTVIDVCTDNITTLEGISAFSNLETLSATGSTVNSSYTKGLSPTGNPSPAPGISVATGKLTSVDLSGLGKLESIDLSRNQLTALDVSNNTALTTLACESNQLTTLNVSNNPSLESLQCQDNPDLSELWLNTGQEISNLDYDSSVTTIYYSDNVTFADANFKAYCVQNFDTDGDGEISTSEALAVTSIDVCTDNITSLDGIEAFSNLEWLYATGSGYKYKSANGTTFVSGNYSSLPDPEPGYSVATGQLTGVDLSGLNKLGTIDISRNNVITYFKPESCLTLTQISCEYCNITELEVNKNPNLRYLNCNSNQLTSLDVSHNTALNSLNCGSNQLTALDVSHNTALRGLNCHDNQLTALDVSHNTALTYLSCSGNPSLAELWLKTGQEIADLSYDSNITHLYYKP